MRIILCVVGGIIAIALLATMLALILRSDDENGSSDKPKDNAINLEDVLSGQLYAKRFNGSWSNGNSVIYRVNAVGVRDLHSQ